MQSQVERVLHAHRAPRHQWIGWGSTLPLTGHGAMPADRGGPCRTIGKAGIHDQTDSGSGRHPVNCAVVVVVVVLFLLATTDAADRKIGGSIGWPAPSLRRVPVMYGSKMKINGRSSCHFVPVCEARVGEMTRTIHCYTCKYIRCLPAPTGNYLSVCRRGEHHTRTRVKRKARRAEDCPFRGSRSR